MSEEAIDTIIESGEGHEADGAGSKKKKLILIIIIALLVIGGGFAALFLTGVLGGGDADGEDIQQVSDPLLVEQTVYFDLDEFLVNLNNPGKQVSFLKMMVTLELPNLKTKQSVEANMPRIRDSFQVYLRELRSSDLQGSAGVHRLREELLLRVNKVISPDAISDILFKEIIVQ